MSPQYLQDKTKLISQVSSIDVGELGNLKQIG